jgi:glycyl-tRNA synthetase
MGIDRSLYTILEHSMIKDNGRNLLRLPAYLSPVQVGVFPLVNKNGIRDMAKQIHEGLKLDYDTIYDSAGSIGRRYRRQDELGTPICITVDYASLTDDSVTLRLRDSMRQERIHRNKIGNRISEIISYSA